MTRDHLEMLAYVAQKETKSPVQSQLSNSVLKDLADMGYVRRIASEIKPTARGLTLLGLIANQIKVGQITPTAGALRILMMLSGDTTPRNVSLFGVIQLVRLNWIDVAADDTIVLTQDGENVCQTILTFIKNR